MKTMSGSPCLHHDCSNRNSFGYCQTTVCINEHYQQEQFYSTNYTNTAIGGEKRTNADRIRSMTDEELATKLYLFTCVHVFDSEVNCKRIGCKKCWLNWLKQEAEGEE